MLVYRHYLVLSNHYQIDTFGSGTSSSEIRLKTTLPPFCDLNRAVRRALTQSILPTVVYLHSTNVSLKYFTVAFAPRVVLY